jgi:hypothetical protein
MQIESEKFWKVADAITTTCPLCGFLRGLSLGMCLGALLMLLD